MSSYYQLQKHFWGKQVQSVPLERRLAYIESHFPGSYGCGWEQDIFYPLPPEDAQILHSLWVESYLQIFGNAPGPDEGPASLATSFKAK